MPELLYRYRAAILRRFAIEPIDDPSLIERITVHAADSTEARRAIQWLTGAAVVMDAERLSDEPIALRARPSGEMQIWDVIAASFMRGAAA